MIGSLKECAVIDPQRDVDQYIEEANKEGLTITYIIETHLHADFVSGHKELSQRTGAKIIFGRNANAAFEYMPVKDGDSIKIGTVTLSFIETPGHTPESICILAKDESDQLPAKLFSGDTLFIGDVGRPDLVGSKGFTAKQMAAMMYESLHEKLLKLSDDVEIFPAHGAGSLCGKHLSSERSSTLGQQKKFNYALKPMSKEAFIETLIKDQPEIPAYFTQDVEINRLGALPLEALPSPRNLSPNEAAITTKLQQGALIIDLRPAIDFAAGHIEGALNIGLGGQFASWAGTLISIGTPIVLVANDKTQVDQAVMRLARVGIESVIGYFQSDIKAWIEAGFKVIESSVTSVAELKQALECSSDLIVLDVRRVNEYNDGHVPNAINIPLAELSQNISKIQKNRPIAIICESGYRSAIAKSILERDGIKPVTNVLGGTAAWKKAGYETQQKKLATA